MQSTAGEREREKNKQKTNKIRLNTILYFSNISKYPQVRESMQSYDVKFPHAYFVKRRLIKQKQVLKIQKSAQSTSHVTDSKKLFLKSARKFPTSYDCYTKIFQNDL